MVRQPGKPVARVQQVARERRRTQRRRMRPIPRLPSAERVGAAAMARLAPRTALASSQVLAEKGAPERLVEQPRPPRAQPLVHQLEPRRPPRLPAAPVAPAAAEGRARPLQMEAMAAPVGKPRLRPPTRTRRARRAPRPQPLEGPAEWAMASGTKAARAVWPWPPRVRRLRAHSPLPPPHARLGVMAGPVWMAPLARPGRRARSPTAWADRPMVERFT